MGITFDMKRAETIAKCGRAIGSPTVLAACKSTIDRELAKFGTELKEDRTGKVPKIQVRIGSFDDGLMASVGVINNDMYDAMMANKNTAIGSLEHITCGYTITQVLVNYGINLKIHFTFQCDLPGEDLETLRMLGKIHTEHHTSSDSYTTQTIICEK